MRRVVVLVVVLVTALGSLFLAAGAAGASTKAFCRAYKPFNLLYGAQYGVGVAPSPEQIAAVDDELDARVSKVEHAAPKAIAADVKTVADVFHSGFANVVAGAEPEYYDALLRIDDWALAHCGYVVVRVTARDFELRGVPKALKAGFIAFRVGNGSDQDHLFEVVRAKNGESAAQLAALPRDEALRRVDVVAAPVSASPGAHTVSYAQLGPGRYIAIDPNFLSQQMYASFRVKG